MVSRVPRHFAFRFAAVLAGILAAGLRADEPARASSPVTVNFSSPEKFTDVRQRYADPEFGREEYMGMFKDYLEKRAPAYLTAGQKLAVTFTDIDLAGDFEPWWGIRSDDLRVLREIYPPRMKLSFVLTDANGVVVKQGERALADTAYLLSKPGFSDDALRYDKALLDRWLKAEFPRPKN